jgi:hypothetical protein
VRLIDEDFVVAGKPSGKSVEDAALTAEEVHKTR